MDTLRYSVIRYRRIRRLDVGDQVWQIIAIAFGEVDFVANPIDLALGGITYLSIVGRVNVATSWWSIVVLAPVYLPSVVT